MNIETNPPRKCPPCCANPHYGSRAGNINPFAEITERVGMGRHFNGENSVVKDSFTTGAGGNRQGFLDRSNRWRFHEQLRATEALAADQADVTELEAAERKLLTIPEGKGE